MACVLAVVPVVGSAPSAAAAAATSGATNVMDYGAHGDGSGDDTSAFTAAMTAALQPGAVRFANGPTGDPQGVVYVPAGTYRLLNLTFPSNLRLEVDAGAVLEQAGGRTATAPAGYASRAPSIILWDGPAGAPVRNVSLVGVGSATGGRKTAADPVATGWSVASDFTFDLDPSVTNANNTVSAVLAINVDGFAIANVLSIQNDSQPSSTSTDWWPSTRKAAFVTRARSDTPIDGSAFYDPHNGTISDWYNVHAPRGFGPNQITSGHNLTFSNLFSQGGTALRLETDNSDGTTFGSEVRSLSANHVVGQQCNRAVAFAPHEQDNTDVHVTGVTAIGCYQGVIESVDESAPAERRGAFTNSTLDNVSVVSGSGAQLPVQNGNGTWTVSSSYQALARDRTESWAVVYTAGTYACTGPFTVSPDRIETTAGEVRPTCSSGTSGGGGGTTTLAAPTGVTGAALAATKVKVSWNAVAGATGYRLSRATTSGGPYTVVISQSARSYKDTQLKRHTTYFYVVQALAGTEASPNSAEVSVTTPS
ncbi:MAG TPA: glycosyl hydrolase family 28-related protein [Acidimicrobiales bacterium]|nr:glycosyl hydrolase family 28-related protein [Acidimicrobiales bacterium]